MTKGRAEEALHESVSEDGEIEASSDRSFGFVFAVFFAAIGLWPLLREPRAIRAWALAVAMGCLILAIVAPKALAPFNRVWFRLGLLLNRIVSPVLLGAVFFLAIVPMAAIMRALGKDPLRLRFDGSVPSYWILREPPGPPPESMDRQF